jgi:hypothetical protein
MVGISNVRAKWTWGHLLFLDVEDHIEKHGHMREVPSCALCGLVETWECGWFLVSQKHFTWWWQLVFNCIGRHMCTLHYRPINSNPTIAHTTHWMRNLLMAKGQFARAQNITKVPKGWNIDMELMWRPAANWKLKTSQHVHPITMYNLHWLFKQYKSNRMLCFIACF